MKRPTWATVAGVLGIIVGCFGIICSANSIILPKIIAFQREIILTVLEDVRGIDRPPEAVLYMLRKMFDIPAWYGVWSVISGILGLLVSGYYVLSSVFLLQIKKSSVPIFYSAAAIGILFSLMKAIVAMSISSIIGISEVSLGMAGILIGLILIIITVTGDKRAFAPAGNNP